MFPKKRINIIYRLLCLICFIVVLLATKSIRTALILFIVFGVLSLFERCYRDIVLIVITILVLGVCYLLNNYVLLRIILVIDYSFYFLDTSYYSDDNDEIRVDKIDFLRFNIKKKKKGSNNITAVYLTVHLVILFLTILGG